MFLSNSVDMMKNLHRRGHFKHEEACAKIMKNADQYSIKDGIISPPSDVSKIATISSVSDAPKLTDRKLKPVKKRKGLRIRELVVQQCTEDLISPAELSKRHGVSIRTIQIWVTSSGAKLPLKYKKKIPKVQKVKLDPCTKILDDNKKIARTAKKRPSLSLSVSLHCHMCNFETSRKNCLDAHIKSHISCELCGKVFPGKPKLAVHLTTHKQKKKQVCMFCNREFNDKSNKWRHEKICKKRPEGVKLLGQEGNKPFKCNECDKAFFTKQYMKVHKKKFHNQNDTF